MGVQLCPLQATTLKSAGLQILNESSFCSMYVSQLLPIQSPQMTRFGVKIERQKPFSIVFTHAHEHAYFLEMIRWGAPQAKVEYLLLQSASVKLWHLHFHFGKLQILILRLWRASAFPPWCDFV